MDVPLWQDRSHRRRNPLLDEWVLVSPHRSARPWLGQIERPPDEQRPAFDGECYLCPGNVRANGARNPKYEGTYVFANDFPALLPGAFEEGGNSLFSAASVTGECRVICYSPRHDLTMADMSVAGIRRVVDAWSVQDAELRQTYKWVQIFENKGESMGCSNPHPHGQIWASNAIPTIVAKEDATQTAHMAAHQTAMLSDVARLEIGEGTRVVVKSDDWVAIVPFWATWPFETMLISRTRARTFADLTDAQRESLAEILKRLLTGYDALFGVSFPYSMGWHAAPTDCECPDAWTLHAHFYPPLLRSATVRKFMVGYEMLAEPQRDLTPEQAAERLRSVMP